MRFIFLIILSVTLMYLPQTIFAAKPRVRKSPASVVVSQPTGHKYSSVKLSRPTNSIIVTFINSENVTKYGYELSYTARGIPQGVMGALTPADNNQTRDMYFGTCSKSACTPHSQIRNVVLVVKTSLKSGGAHIKRYVIKW